MNTAIKQPNQINNLKNGNSVVCKKCKSNQVVGNKRGYSFGLMFKVLFSMIGIGIISRLLFGLMNNFINTLIIVPVGICFFLSLPTALLCGFIGRGDIINGCMNCGNKWKAGKR
ncbi:hypothetical protein ACFUP3_19275 [Bacillus paralicheniformis]|uniref:hypothetical protein n=1 Tax=Bacillus paralicheniformis TaxID=1648923 RepID=UPI0035F58CFB